jgi:hypothetical protein
MHVEKKLSEKSASKRLFEREATVEYDGMPFSLKHVFYKVPDLRTHYHGQHRIRLIGTTHQKTLPKGAFFATFFPCFPQLLPA